MSEVQFWHIVATGALFLLVGILGFIGKGVLDDMKTKLSKEEFKDYLDEASESRKNLRDSIVKLFEKMEGHEKLDSERFQVLTKDFNGGLQSMRDLLYTSKLEILREMNGKVDKGK
jgi:hypothetical protein